MYLSWPYLDMSTTQTDLVNIAVLATHFAFAAAFGCLAAVSGSGNAAVASPAAEMFRWIGLGLFPVVLSLDWFLGGACKHDTAHGPGATPSPLAQYGWAADHVTVSEFIFGQGPSRPVSRVIENQPAVKAPLPKASKGVEVAL